MPAANSLKILVVDDQQSMRGLARQCLKKLGVLNVAVAASADQAMEFMGSQKFDAIISDLNMPGKSGLDLAKQVKTHPVLKATPFFLATSDAYRDRVAEGEVDHFMAKPFSVADMRSAIEAHLGGLN